MEPRSSLSTILLLTVDLSQLQTPKYPAPQPNLSGPNSLGRRSTQHRLSVNYLAPRKEAPAHQASWQNTTIELNANQAPLGRARRRWLATPQALLSTAEGFPYPLVDYSKPLVNKSPLRPLGWSKLLASHPDKVFRHTFVDSSTIVLV